MFLGLLLVVGACGGGNGSPVPPTPSTPVAPTVRAIEVDPPTPSLVAGTTLPIRATALYTDDTRRDISTEATWTSSNTAVALVDPVTRKLQGVAQGSASITAELNGVRGSALVAVTAATAVSLRLEPSTASIAKGTQAQFTARATFTDRTEQDIGSQVDWTSSNAAVASVDPNGLATGTGTGQASITATCKVPSVCATLSANAALEVSAATLATITLVPADAQMPLGTKQQFTATGTFTDQTTQDLSTQVTWASTDTDVATIDVAGLASTVAKGSTKISAMKDGVSASPVDVAVTDAELRSLSISVDGDSNVGIGQSKQFQAQGSYSDGSTKDVTTQVTWKSTNTDAATISNSDSSQGRAQAQGAYGTSSITASLQGIESQPQALTVGPAVFTTVGAASWQAPAAMTVRLVVLGGGGSTSNDSSPGGHGGTVTFSMQVAKNQTLALFVGRGGAPQGGQGGQASTVNVGATDQIIAGGGGGGGDGAANRSGGGGGNGGDPSGNANGDGRHRRPTPNGTSGGPGGRGGRSTGPVGSDYGVGSNGGGWGRAGGNGSITIQLP